MNERLKQIRAKKKMNQADFAKSLGIGQSTLAMMEVGKREISERHIKTICAIFGVNECWLRDGVGDMFTETNSTVISSLVDEYDLDPLEREVEKQFAPFVERYTLQELKRWNYDFLFEIAKEISA